jgi:hypothetical protein
MFLKMEAAGYTETWQPPRKLRVVNRKFGNLILMAIKPPNMIISVV